MRVFLGTALWGWGVSRSDAFALLDRFYAAGGRYVDAAANYPINRNAADFGLSTKYLGEWLAANPGSDLGVLYKVGSVNNLGGPETALTPSDVFLSAELAKGHFGEALSILSVHWDNRESAEDISGTVEVLEQIAREGYEVGLSGIKRPDLYRRAATLPSSQFWVQVKENAASQEARLKYFDSFPDAKFIAYGINMGGVKLEPPVEGSSAALRGVQEPPVAQTLRDIIASPDGLNPKPSTLNHLALLLAWTNAALTGVIIGPRNTAQLEDNLAFISAIEGHDDLVGLREALHRRLRHDRH